MAAAEHSPPGYGSVTYLGTYVRIIPGRGAKLRERRIKRGWTQAQLGTLCSGSSQATISLIEQEKLKTCTVDLAEDLCKWLDILEIEDYFEVRGDESSSDKRGTRRRPGRRGGRP